MGGNFRKSIKEKTQSANETSKENPLYGVAMLKVALELKRPNAPPLDEIVSAVLTKMKLSRAEFEEYLQQNLGFLRALGPHKRT
jgi:hypothetical protein